MKRVIIIGGGITGLSAAYRLTRLAEEKGLDIDVTVLEASRRWGGKILTEKKEGMVMEGGPESFMTAGPHTLDLVRELGLGDELVSTAGRRNDVYVHARGRLRRFPEGLALMAPRRVWPFLASDIMTWRGKLRMGLDYLLPRGGAEDESLAVFVRRRFGTEALKTLAEPVMAGIYAGDSAQLSLRSTFPQFVELERSHASVLRGLRATRPPAPTPGTTLFMTLSGGLSQLTDALVSRLGPDRLRLDSPVDSVRFDGSQYGVLLKDATELRADGVILAVPAAAASRAVQSLSETLALALGSIPFASSLTISLAYDEALPLPPGFGFVTSRSSGLRVTAGTFASAKFPGRAPLGKTLIRCFLGGAGREGIVGALDRDLLAVVRADLKSILGIEAVPRFYRVYRWPRGNPQYNVGHRAILGRIDEITGRYPGLLVAGASYHGPGIPNCIRSGDAAAKELAGMWSTA